MTSRHYPERPIVGVGAVVVKDGDVLLIRRSNPPRAGEWSLPGGAQKLGETVLAAALREVLEETAIVAQPISLIDVVDLISRDAKNEVETHYTLVDFALRWVSGSPVAGDDASDARFFQPHEILGLGLWSETQRMIDEGLKLVLASPRTIPA